MSLYVKPFTQIYEDVMLEMRESSTDAAVEKNSPVSNRRNQPALDTNAQAATETIADDLVKLMGDDELGHVWAAWHPHRFAAGAAYGY